MLGTLALDSIARDLRAARGLAGKRDIAMVAARLSLSADSVVPVGDDCAAIADGDGYLLFAIEGFMNEFVERDPWFAGWCGVMVNLSDVAAMGGRPIGVVDAVWAAGDAAAMPLLDGMRAASETYGVPIVGGHTNARTDRSQLSVAILGRAKNLLTSFDANPAERLIAAIDLRGRYREPFANWEAATDAAPARLRADLEVLPSLAEAGLAVAAKDISQGGVVGTTMMLAECSRVGAVIDIARLPRPPGAPLERWLMTFPSYGFVVAARPENVEAVIGQFAVRGIAAAEIGEFTNDHRVTISDGRGSEVIWDFTREPLLGCASAEASLATLKERGFISSFARTVHHVDAFQDEGLATLQRRSIMAADQLFVVSELWRDWLAREFKRNACKVGNGVDSERFSPRPDETDAELHEELGLRPSETVFLAIGGVEERKNTVRLLQAFQAVRLQIPASRLVIAGGASLLDHGAYQAQFAGILSHAGDAAAAVMRTGPLRQRLMPALYRAAACLVCASTKEGFGLVVLEAMASGVPVVASRIAPFTEYLGGDDVLWFDPGDVSSIAAAMTRSVDPAARALLFERGMRVAARHDWISVAKAHVAAYQNLRDPIYA